MFDSLPAFLVRSGLTGCKKPPDDKALLQGEWELMSVELPKDPERTRQEAEELKEVTVSVQGDRVTLSHAKEKGGMAAAFTLDQTKASREVDIVDATVGRSGRTEGEHGHDARHPPALRRRVGGRAGAGRRGICRGLPSSNPWKIRRITAA